MTTNTEIKIWQDRQDDDQEQWNPVVYMKAEIAELRAALEAAQQQLAQRAGSGEAKPADGMQVVHQLRSITGHGSWQETDADGETLVKRMPHWADLYVFRTLYTAPPGAMQPGSNGCTKCGLTGIHACTGAPIPEWTDEKVSELHAVLSQYPAEQPDSGRDAAKPVGYVFGNSYWEEGNPRLTDEIRKLGAPRYAAPPAAAVQSLTDAEKLDAARLDFLDANPEKQLRYHKNRWALVGFTNYPYEVFRSVREAIDAASAKGVQA